MDTDLAFEVARILFLTFNTKSKEERDECETRLKELSENTENYCEALLGIINSVHQEMTPHIKNSAAIQIKKVFKDQSKNISQETKQRVALAILSSMMLPGLNEPIVASLGYSLSPILSEEEGDTIVLPTILNAIIEGFTSESYKISGSCKAVKSIFNGSNSHPVLFSFFLELNDLLILYISQLLEVLNTENNPESAENSVFLLYELFSVFTSMIEHFEMTNKEKLFEIIGMYKISEIFGVVLNMNLLDEQTNEHSFFCTGNSPLYHRFNEVKSEILQSLNILLNFLTENRETILEDEGQKVLSLVGVDMPDSPFVNMLFGLQDTIVTSLVSTLLSHDILEIEENLNLNSILVETIILEEKLVKENKFKIYFAKYHKELILNVCISLFKANSEDLESIIQEPQNFLWFSEDLCEAQESEKLKTVAASLFESICMNVDGALVYAVNVCLHLISYPLQGLSPEFELAHNTSEFFEEILVESGLISLSVISHIVCRRRDLLVEIERTLKLVWESIIKVDFPVVQQRLCMFLNYYSSRIFTAEFLEFHNMVKYIVSLCNTEKYQVAVTIEAALTLKSFFTEEGTEYKMDDLLKSIMNSLIQLIPIENHLEFYEVLNEIVENSHPIIKGHIFHLAATLVTKIQTEFELKKGVQTFDSTVILKSWGILKTLVSQKNVSLEEIFDLEQILIPLFEYLHTPLFQEDIILFETSLMRKCQCVTEAGWNLFSELPAIQETQEGTFLHIFPILNCFINFGSEFFVQSPSHLLTIIEMSKTCLFSYYKNTKNEAANAEGALVFQLLFQKFSNLLDNYIADIFSTCIKRMIEAIRYDFLRISLLGVILAGFWYNVEASVLILTNIQYDQGTYLGVILDMIIAHKNSFKHAYIKKLVSIGLIQLLRHPSLPEEALIKLPFVFKTLVAILKQDESAAESETTKLRLKKSERQNKMSIIIKGPRKGGPEKEELEYSLALANLITPLTHINECEFFTQSLNEIREYSPEGFRFLLSELDLAEQVDLKNIIECKKVELLGFGTEVTEIRRILKPKHRYA